MPLELEEEFTGTGDLFKGESPLYHVKYHSSIFQEYFKAGPQDSRIPGLRRIVGKILEPGSQGYFGLIGQDLTLKLEDGRFLDLFITDTHGMIAARSAFYVKN